MSSGLSPHPIRGRLSLHPIRGRLSLHPIHVLAGRVARAFTSRHRVPRSKVLVKLFQKLVVSKGKAFGRAPQGSKYLALFSLYPQSSVENLLVKKKNAFFHILHRKLWKIKGLSRGQSARREQGRLLKFSQVLCQNCKIVPSPILGENKMLYNKKKLFVQKGRAGG